ncbi:hypothetical protein DFJ68_1229 [Terracoccus luteus]|uniref:Peptidase MA superfamily protein n=1 Tax=Terracoccus luteus TaxID=53356 RepID=A0A495XTE1_9MICO|nr:hypothetical protein [Terracoccus luteus]RKT77801.1 hypothetical protein DFJ68_1229 [Terracoccus luteus]
MVGAGLVLGSAACEGPTVGAPAAPGAAVASSTTVTTVTTGTGTTAATSGPPTSGPPTASLTPVPDPADGGDGASDLVRDLAAGVQATVVGTVPAATAPWLALLQPGAVRRRAEVVVDRMRSMGVGDLSLRSVVPVPTAAGTTGVDHDTSTVRASFTYRFTGIDVADRTFTLDLTVRRPATPSPSATTGVSGPGQAPGTTVTTVTAHARSSGEVVGWSPSDRPQPWDLDGVVATRTGGSLVVAPAGPTLTDLAGRVAPALGAVSSVWRDSAPAVVVLPARDGDAARLLGRGGLETSADAQGGPLRDVAAVTDGPSNPGVGAGADRVVVVPSVWAGLTSAGRDVVLTHELTHVVVRRTTTASVPLWLSEGFAELVAYRRAGLPDRVGVTPALTGDDGGRVTALPADRDFDPSSGDLPKAYARSLAVVRAAAAGPRGLDGVVRLYRAVAGGHDLDAALVSELSTTPEQLVTDADARLRALAGPADPASTPSR